MNLILVSLKMFLAGKKKKIFLFKYIKYIEKDIEPQLLKDNSNVFEAKAFKFCISFYSKPVHDAKDTQF